MSQSLPLGAPVTDPPPQPKSLASLSSSLLFFLNTPPPTVIYFLPLFLLFFFFLNDPAPPEISPLPLHDALPISRRWRRGSGRGHHDAGRRRGRTRRRSGRRPGWCFCRRARCGCERGAWGREYPRDRKSTRLNSSHGYISYAVFCLKKKKNNFAKRPATAARPPSTMLCSLSPSPGMRPHGRVAKCQQVIVGMHNNDRTTSPVDGGVV